MKNRIYIIIKFHQFHFFIQNKKTLLNIYIDLISYIYLMNILTLLINQASYDINQRQTQKLITNYMKSGDFRRDCIVFIQYLTL